RGDPLIRLDRRLATVLDGVYRPGEFYLRWLERIMSFNFGTRPGRLLTKYVTLPVGGGFLLLEILLIILSHLPFGHAETATDPAVPTKVVELVKATQIFGMTASPAWEMAAATMGT